MNNQPPSSIPGEAHPGVYKLGTLTYTRKDLLRLFVLLLGGDFAMVFFESIFGPFGTLYTKQFHASNVLIGAFNGSVPGLVNIFFGPSISRWSDNFRSSWGRRIPFLAGAVPMIFVSLIAMGFAPELAGLIHPFVPSASLDNIVLIVLTAFVIVFHFANMILINSYTWLQRDTIPQEVMARFLSWFRIVSIGGAALFSWYIFPHVIDDRKIVCLSLGAFYVVVFAFMCRYVKEGEYPPPVEEKGNAVQLYVRYFRQCFTVPIYRWAFIGRMIAGMAVCASTYDIFSGGKPSG